MRDPGSVQFKSYVKGKPGKKGFKIKQQGISSGAKKKKNACRLITTRDIQRSVKQSFNGVVHLTCARAFKKIPIR